MKQITGGVCAAQGFKAAGIHCGIRKNQSKRDLALIVSDCPASAAAVYTTNLVKGAPLLVTKAHLADGKAQAILCNSGNANTCNADGPQVAQAMCQLAAEPLGIAAEDVVDPYYIRHYVSDRSDYEMIFRTTREQEGNTFFFNVTMQNHSGYAQGWNNLERTIDLPAEPSPRAAA